MKVEHLASVSVLILSLATIPARAETVEEFYRGKTITFVIGYPAGGANDAFVRAAANHIGKHIPGKSRLIVKNMPGAGSLIAANYLFNSAPKDGTVVALLAATTPLEEALGSSMAKYKAAEFNWIGRMSSAINVTFVNATSPVKTIEDALRTQVVLAATGRSATPAVYPGVLNKVLGTKFKIVVGYEGSIACMLAMERGEADGHSTSWDGLKSAHEDWVKTKKVNILVQYGLRRHPDLPDVRTTVELGRNPTEVQVLRVVANATEVGKMMLTTPGVPPERLDALRRAFDKMARDPEYLEEMEKRHLESTPLSGEQMQELVREVSSAPPEILQKVKEVYPLD